MRRWDLVALVLNFIVGAGIFGLPSRVQALAGDFSLLAYVVCACCVFVIILCFAEVSSRFDETGGLYLYARATFGPVVGFQIGWLAWLARLTGFAALCNLFADYLVVFIPAVALGPARVSAVLFVVLVLTVVNLLGVRQSSTFNNLFTLGKLLPLLLLVAGGVFLIDPSAYSASGPPTYQGFSAAVLLLLFAFTGFENAVIPAGEARDPRRDLPFALLVGTASTAVLYIVIQAVSIGTVPSLADSARPLADAGIRIFGPSGATVMALGALVSILGTLNGVLLAGSRLLFAMAEQRQLPVRFLATHERFRTPYVAILVTAIAVVLLTVTGTFLAAVRLSSVIRLTTYAVTCAAVPLLRRRDGVAAPFTIPAGNIVTVTALLIIGWLFTASEWADAGLVLTAAAGGALLYLVTARGRPSIARS